MGVGQSKPDGQAAATTTKDSQTSIGLSNSSAMPPNPSDSPVEPSTQQATSTVDRSSRARTQVSTLTPLGPTPASRAPAAEAYSHRFNVQIIAAASATTLFVVIAMVAIALTIWRRRRIRSLRTQARPFEGPENVAERPRHVQSEEKREAEDSIDEQPVPDVDVSALQEENARLRAVVAQLRDGLEADTETLPSYDSRSSM
ncbi:hypothetical protein EXIGLDRAFT_770887 [Exidia glandulosa HHB12029]|uniref:Transmembrane protein n=1 Tax=Exidia glandulosa HHB12029 TaxID=1314781 RepID=A0A165GE99_EXIGL|nr:hypothetical protein EXIGLDRAFT_770887 [Exidia glandulosa HHB12029]